MGGGGEGGRGEGEGKRNCSASLTFKNIIFSSGAFLF